MVGDFFVKQIVVWYLNVVCYNLIFLYTKSVKFNKLMLMILDDIFSKFCKIMTIGKEVAGNNGDDNDNNTLTRTTDFIVQKVDKFLRV